MLVSTLGVEPASKEEKKLEGDPAGATHPGWKRKDHSGDLKMGI